MSDRLARRVGRGLHVRVGVIGPGDFRKLGNRGGIQSNRCIRQNGIVVIGLGSQRVSDGLAVDRERDGIIVRPRRSGIDCRPVDLGHRRGVPFPNTRGHNEYLLIDFAYFRQTDQGSDRFKRVRPDDDLAT